MQLGMIGLGRMGANMVRRLGRAGHDCVVYDVSAPAVQALAREGVTGAASLPAFVQALARQLSAEVVVDSHGSGTKVSIIRCLTQSNDVGVDYARPRLAV